MDRRKFLKVLGVGAAVAFIPVAWTQRARRSAFYVDSVSGSDGATGAPNDPFATISAALDNCHAGEGDIIFIRGGHTETFRGLPSWPIY